MGVVIPQVVTSGRATGAQIIDGSLKFDGSQELEFTPGSDGDLKTATWSFWIKRAKFGSNDTVLGFGPNNTNDGQIYFNSSDKIYIFFRKSSSTQLTYETTRVFRDTGWYHIVVSVDTTQASGQVKLYVNGEEVTSFGTSTDTTQNADLIINDATYTNYIGNARGNTSTDLDCMLSNVYLIDGQRLDASYFGFTDGLTNTWKPKKYEGTFGTNGFWLPFDGSAPIGQDQSGQGNDWTPVNFGGSVELDNPQVSGARPILNTTQGGSQAGVGVFGSKQNVGYAVTVYDDGGGNKYYIDGVKQATLTGLIRGATYTFDTSDSTVGSTHPFRFAASDGGSQYSNGVAAITGTATTITIPYNAPNELYYYCTSHSGMGSSITGITTNEKLADQYASNCVLALPLVGSAVDVCASIACTMSAKTLAVNGDATSSGEASNFYAESFKFDGSGDYLGATSNSDFAMGTGDFTLECWVYRTGGTAFNNFIATRGASASANGYTFGAQGSANGYDVEFYTNGLQLDGGDQDITYDKWHHVAVTRKGTVLSSYVNGVLNTTATNSQDFSNTSLAVGITNDASQNPMQGHLCDVRIYKGVAKYSGGSVGDQVFVPPATSPDILPDTPSGVSGGSKLTKITDGAVSFAGDGGDYLRVEHADMAMGTGDLTVEAFIYNNVHRNYVNYIGTRESGQATNNGWCIASNSGGALYVYSNGLYTNLTTQMNTHTWYHVAYVRESGTHKWYVDGILRGTDSTSRDYTDDLLTIGDNSYFTSTSNDEPLSGHISNVRIIKGTALYSGGRFTPPTAPLTNVTNTKLLCCQSNTSTTEAAVTPVSVTATGTVASNFNPFNTDINTVRGQESGYPTLNPNNNNGGTLSNGNLSLTSSGAANVSATLQIPTTGKYYWEYLLNGTTSGGVVGISDGSAMNGTALADWTKIYGYSPNGNKYENASSSSYGATLTGGDLVGVKYDADTRQLEFFKNGISQGVAFTVSSDYDYYPTIHGNVLEVIANFGQKPFKFPPPDGFQPLNAANARPDKVISRPDQYVGAAVWTVPSGSADTRISAPFKPDLVMAKNRSGTDGGSIYNSVSGDSKFQRLLSTSGEMNDAEATSATRFNFNVDGFTFEADNDNANYGSGDLSVAWYWKAGGGKSGGGGFFKDDVEYASAAAAGLSGGSLTVTASSVGTKQGFSIIHYEGNGSGGATVSHGLSQTPDLFFIACRDITNGNYYDTWHSGYYVSGGSGKNYMRLTTSDGAKYASDMFQTPTSSVVTLGSSSSMNGNTNEYTLYCWHDVPGFQKFGTYEGNNDSDGPFVELGFNPAIIWTKSIDSDSKSWEVHWNSGPSLRENPQSERLILNENSARATSNHVDFLSNGFKIRNTFSGMNNATETWLYCAWADVPSIDLYGGGANAR